MNSDETSQDDVSTKPLPVVPPRPPAPPLPARKQLPTVISLDARLTEQMADAFESALERSGIPDMLEKLTTTLPEMITNSIEEALKRRDEAYERTRPKDIKQRLSPWQLIFREALPAGLVICLVSLTILGLVWGFMNWPMFWILLGCIIVCGGIMWCIYFLWRITFHVCNEQEVGIARRRVRWLLLSPLKPKYQPMTINIKDLTQNPIASALDIDCWRLKLYTPGEEVKSKELGEDENPILGSPDLDLRFLRGGEKFLDTINKFQSHLQHRR